MQPDPAEPSETSTDRRSGDRRRGDRRNGSRRAEESFFGADSAFAPGWAAADADGGLAALWPRRVIGAEDSALTRIYRTYAAARAAFGVAIVVAQGASSLLGVRGSLLLTLVCIAYAVQAVTLWLLPRFRALTSPLTSPQVQPALQRRQWLATIGIDLLAFGTLHLVELGSNFNYGALLVLPVLMAGVMTPRLLALGTAAGVTLLLLVVAWRSHVGGDLPPAMLQSGLAGLGLFVIALLAGELSGRLAREEQAARGSLELARQQAQLNRLVIEEMADGVLVVDGRSRVRAANPAARALLVDQGLSPPAPFGLQTRPAWAALAQAVAQALAEQDWPEAGREVRLVFDDGQQRSLRMRVRFMRSRALAAGASGGEPLCVLLLEDVRTLQARLRQDKLAAMGRVSAGIAHEIRNPLAAIVQANALLLEDELPPSQQRLARMVADNAERLKRIVDDVMELVPGDTPLPRAIDAAAEVAAVAGEWARTVGLPLGPASRLRVDLPAFPLGVSFDPDHLRRLLVNLLDNAHRHASGAPGAILLRLAPRDEGGVLLAVASDGPPIAPDVEPYLFEPFFSTRSRGTGLGLYICRELCERYGASIEYRALPPSERSRNEFLVTMKRSLLSSTETPLPLSS